METGGARIRGDKEFVRIHYLILEELAKAPLTGGELRCLLWLLRKTYGWNKKEDKISLSQWEEGTGMKRQNVWSILQTLLKRNIIYTKSGGPKRAATWGFNKYYESWAFDSVMPGHDKSVSPEHDSSEQSVMPEHDRLENSVMPQHDKSVIPPHERTTDKKDKLGLLAADDDDETDSVTALVRTAYNTVGKIAPSFTGDDGRANIVAASGLIERYGFATCVRGLSILKERNNAMLKKNGRNGIRAPISYLRIILEGELEASAVTPQPTTILDFAVEEIIP